MQEATAGEIVALAGLRDRRNRQDVHVDRAARSGWPASPSKSRPSRSTSSSTTRRSPGRKGSTSPPASCATGSSRSWSGTWRSGSSRPIRPTPTRVSGRGELHLGILMETMRREGYEFQVSRPRVITQDGRERRDAGAVRGADDRRARGVHGRGDREARSPQGRDDRDAEPGAGDGAPDVPDPGARSLRLPLRVPDRHARHRDHAPPVPRVRAVGRSAGGPDARRAGGRSRRHRSSRFALVNLQERAQLFVAPGELVYEGMIVGENSRPGDMDVNVGKEKKLSNMRTTSTDENIQLEPPRPITLEYALEYIEDDELIEVTPGEHPAAQARACRPPNGRRRSVRRTGAPTSEMAVTRPYWSSPGTGHVEEAHHVVVGDVVGGVAGYCGDAPPV